MMPEKGLQRRTESLTELAAMAHESLTDPRVEQWLEDADQSCTDDEKKLALREMRRVWEDSICLPVQLVKEKVRVGSHCEHAWRQQRLDHDWDGFRVNFEPVVQCAREEAALRLAAGSDDLSSPYAALMNLYCRGDSIDMVESVFSELAAQLPALIGEIMEHQKAIATTDVAETTFDIAAQKQLNTQLLDYLGFDFRAGRLDESVHPFSTGDRGDQRITTRYSENEFLNGLMGTAHEAGHASYEGNLPERWSDQPLGESRNMSIHESQSLLFEKQLFLSKPFFAFFKQHIEKVFPQLADRKADGLWARATAVNPGFIRVDADEVTYPLHIVLRYEIERALINDELSVSDIPDIWNEKMHRYLGLEVGSRHGSGCLQDIHWTDGAFGYFPSYTLGAINAAQLFASIKSTYVDWHQRLQQGELGFVREWLHENIWQHGCRYTSQELMKRATGSETDAQFLIDHVRDRYLMTPCP